MDYPDHAARVGREILAIRGWYYDHAKVLNRTPSPQRMRASLDQIVQWAERGERLLARGALEDKTRQFLCANGAPGDELVLLLRRLRAAAKLTSLRSAQCDKRGAPSSAQPFKLVLPLLKALFDRETDGRGEVAEFVQFVNAAFEGIQHPADTERISAILSFNEIPQ